MTDYSSCFQVPPQNHDVFISFRGPDTRFGFLSHLRERMREYVIDVYVDESIVRGEEISRALEEAIEGSMISLVIFSKNYASSIWCLEELVKIMDCRKTNQQVVVPIFYNIDPSDVRHQTGSYAYAFAEHEEKFKDNVEKLKLWKTSLTKAAKLSGYHYPSSNFRYESELIVEIVNDIVKRLKDKNSKKFKGSKLLHGMRQNISEAASLIKIEPHFHVNGLLGKGGNGQGMQVTTKGSNFKIPEVVNVLSKISRLSAMAPRPHNKCASTFNSEDWKKDIASSSSTVWDSEDLIASSSSSSTTFDSEDRLKDIDSSYSTVMYSEDLITWD